MGRNVRGNYPPDWPAIAKRVKDRAGWRCVRCGHPHERPSERLACGPGCDLARHPEYRPATRLEQAGGPLASSVVRGREGAPYVLRGGSGGRQRQRVLTVAHLDDDRSNCRWWNLAALCQVCHLSTQGRIEMSRPWAFPHSEWFRPHVAGYYAYRYLGQELSREEVQARLDELLLLEAAALGVAL